MELIHKNLNTCLLWIAHSTLTLVIIQIAKPFSNVKPVEYQIIYGIFQISIQKIKIFIVFFLYAVVEGYFFLFLFDKLFLKYVQ